MTTLLTKRCPENKSVMRQAAVGLSDMSCSPAPSAIGAPVDASVSAGRPEDAVGVHSSVQRDGGVEVHDGIESPNILPATRDVKITLPWEVKRAFRTKALVLAVLESLVVLGLIIACDYVLKPDMAHGLALMFGVLTAAMLVLLAFWFMRQQYPVNYMLLSVITVLSGVFWGTADAFAFQDDLNLPTQMSLIMLVFHATWLICVQVRCEDDCGSIVLGAFLSLIAGVGANVLVVKLVNLPLFTLVFSSVAMMCCSVVMLFMVGEKMVRCRADDYMSVAFSLTISLFFVVSAPLIFVFWGLGMNCHIVEGSSSITDRPNDNEREQQLQEQTQA